MNNSISLSQLGWTAFFQQQINLGEWETRIPARIIQHHRSVYGLLSETGLVQLEITTNLPKMTVGDWVLVNQQQQFIRLLERSSLFSRKAVGTKLERQLIAANIDTVFVVCSLNQNFNLNRIERYLSLVNDAGVQPVVVLTKSDLCDNPEDYTNQIRTTDPMLMVEAVNSLNSDSLRGLKPWCETGQTIAFLGSSGVGKSTLINTLMGNQEQTTGSIRDQDGKGRHTTTERSLHFIPNGGILLDTPGMRELQIADCEQGLNETFADITELSSQCQFSDCQHQSEPGCAVTEAINNGLLEPRRLNNYLKMMREQAFNSASLAEKRARDKGLTRYYRSVQKENRKWRKSN